jgi:hypothetical protein
VPKHLPSPSTRDPSRGDDDLQSMVPRTVVVRLALRLHLRPLIMGLGVFLSVAAPGRCAVWLFPLVALRSSTGTHVRHRTRSPPICADRSRTGRPPMRLPAPPTLSTRGIDFGETPRWLGPSTHERPLIEHAPSPERDVPPVPSPFLARHCPTADESVAVMKGRSRRWSQTPWTRPGRPLP